MANISINTIKALCDQVYGENNYGIEQNYCYNVGLSKRTPRTGRCVYRITSNGYSGNWALASTICNSLTKYLNSLSNNAKG